MTINDLELTEAMVRIRAGTELLNYLCREGYEGALASTLADIEAQARCAQWRLLELRGDKSAPDASGKAAQP